MYNYINMIRENDIDIDDYDDIQPSDIVIFDIEDTDEDDEQSSDVD